MASDRPERDEPAHGWSDGSAHSPRRQQPENERAEEGDALAGASPRERIARLEAENRLLREDNTRLHQVLRSAVDYAIITLDLQGFITGWNAGAIQILGYAETEVLGRSGDLVFTAEDRNSGCFPLELRRAKHSGRTANERWHVRRDGTRFWASGLMLPLLGVDEEHVGFLNILRDRTEVQTQAERRELLMAEMKHRVKNTFAMVQAVAAQSSRYAGTITDFQASFASRLVVLAHSHDMLVRRNWEDAPLRDLIESTLGIFCSEPGRVKIEGSSVTIAANLVNPATLVFHELATNAAKHGSLSVDPGTLYIGWSVSAVGKTGRRVDLLWRERGGPVVVQPSRQGFGSHLLIRGLGQFGSSLKLNFHPEGLECRLSFLLGVDAQA